MKQISIIIAFLTLVGCWGPGSFPLEQLNPEITLERLEHQTLNSPKLQKYIAWHIGDQEAWPPQEWDLLRFEFAARFYNPQFALDEARLNVAKSEIYNASMIPNPLLVFSIARDTNVPVGLTPWTIISQLTFYIARMYQRQYLIAEATYSSISQSFHLSQTAWDIRNQLKQALTDLYFAREKAAAAQEHVELIENLLQLQKSRLLLGEISSIILREQRILHEQALLERDTSLQQIRQARIQLAQAIGVPVGELQCIHINFPFDEENLLDFTADLKQLRYLALTSRANILEALYKYTASQVALQLEIARKIPDIQLGPGYTFDQSVGEYAIAAGSLPLPVFNHNQGAVAVAVANRELMRREFISLQSQVLFAIDLAVENYEAAQEKQTTSWQFLEESQKNYQSAEAMYAQGEISYFDLLNATITLNTARIQYTDSLADLQQALNALEYAIHYPLLSNEEPS